MSNLFRKEALEQRRTRRFGSPLVISPLSFKLLAVFVMLLVVAIGCFLYLGTYTRKQTVPGYILPSKGVVTVYAPQRGTVVARYVQLGERVQKGERLFEVKLRRSTQNTADVNAALIENFNQQIAGIHTRIRLTKDLETTKIARLQRQKHDLQSKARRLQDQLHTQHLILSLAQRNHSRYQELAKSGMVSKFDLQKSRRKVLDERAALGEIKQSEAVLARRLHQIPGQIAETRMSMAKQIADYKNQIMQLEQQRLRLRSAQDIVIRAPVAGVVSSITAKVGQNVDPQLPLVSLLPEGSVFEARLLVPARAIGFVHAGQPVLLRYSAFPYQQFGLYHGQVRKVSRSIISPRELNLPVTINQPYYLVTVTLPQPYVLAYGRRMPLASGMTLSADIVINHMRLYEWILRPIESLRGRL